MKRFYLSVFVTLAILSGWSFNAIGQATTFGFTGSVQTYTVPANVSSVAIDLGGASGGGAFSLSPGGGGRVQATLLTVPGQVLYIYVGSFGPPGLDNTT